MGTTPFRREPNVKYYFGIYKTTFTHYRKIKELKVAQLTNEIGVLSDNILSKPGCVKLSGTSRAEVVIKAKLLAKDHDCKLLELNFEKFKILNIK